MVRPPCTIACLSLAWVLSVSFSPWLRAQNKPPVGVGKALEKAESVETIWLRNTHRFEKAFLVRACKLSDEQKNAVDKLDDSWKEALPKPGEEIARQIARAGVGVIQGQLRAGLVRAPSQISQARSMVNKYRSSIRSEFGKLLTEEQRKTYEEELAARDEFKKQADTEALVAVLDNTLNLLPEQREALAKSLAEWPGKENLHVAYYMQSVGYLPVIPDELIVKHLNSEQVSIYRRTPKADVHSNQDQAALSQEAFGE